MRLLTDPKLPAARPVQLRKILSLIGVGLISLAWSRSTIGANKAPDAERHLTATKKAPETVTGIAAASPTCFSASVWRSVLGPNESVTIGDRTLHIPIKLPFYRHLVEGDRTSIWFRFHINPDGTLAPGTMKDFLSGSNELDFHIIDASGAISDSESAKLIVEGHSPEGRLGQFTIFHSLGDDVYIDSSTVPQIAFSCSNKEPFFHAYFHSLCEGFRHPWANVSLSYAFGIEFMQHAPEFNSCITQMLADFLHTSPQNVSQ